MADSSQCDSDPLTTAFGYKIDSLNAYKQKYIAVSRDIEKMFPDGTNVVITGTSYDGNYIVADRMSKRKVSQVDILIDSSMSVDMWNEVIISKTWKHIVRH